MGRPAAASPVQPSRRNGRGGGSSPLLLQGDGAFDDGCVLREGEADLRVAARGLEDAGGRGSVLVVDAPRQLRVPRQNRPFHRALPMQSLRVAERQHSTPRLRGSPDRGRLREPAAGAVQRTPVTRTGIGRAGHVRRLSGSRTQWRSRSGREPRTRDPRRGLRAVRQRLPHQDGRGRECRRRWPRR